MNTIIKGGIAGLLLTATIGYACEPTKTTGQYGDNPLHTAVRSGNIKALRSLAATSGQNELCAKNSMGHTPYDLANIIDNTKAIYVLFSAGALDCFF